jgi:polysaccharide pyruvyl transferase CsaB
MNADNERNGFKALAVGWYGAPNMGDEVLLSVLKHHVGALGGTLMAVSVDPALTRRMHDIETVDYNNLGEIAGALLWADVLILGGGGIFDQHYPFHLRAVYDPTLSDIAAYARPILMARQFGVPVVIWGHGVGPLTGADSRELVRDVFDSAAVASVRDDESLQLLREIGVTRDVAVAPDPGWLYARCCAPPVPRTTPEPGNANAKTLAIVIREWSAGVDWKDKLVAAIEHVKSTDWSVRWVALQAGIEHSGATSDLQVVEELRGRVPDWAKGSVSIPTSPGETWAELSTADAVVSMRLHASILALSARRPVAGIEYDGKLARAHRMAGMPDALRVPLDSPPERYEHALATLLEHAPAWIPGADAIARLQDRAASHLTLLDGYDSWARQPKQWHAGNFDWMATWLQQSLADLRAARTKSQYAHELLDYRDMLLAQKDAELGAYSNRIADAERQLQTQRVRTGELEHHVSSLQIDLAESRSTRAHVVGLLQALRRTARRVLVAPFRFVLAWRQLGWRAALRLVRNRLGIASAGPAPTPLPQAETADAAPAQAKPVRAESLLVIADELADGNWPSRAAALAMAAERAGFPVRVWQVTANGGNPAQEPRLAHLLTDEAGLREYLQAKGTRVLLASVTAPALVLAEAARAAGAEVILDLATVDLTTLDDAQLESLQALASRAVSRDGAGLPQAPRLTVTQLPDGGDNEFFDSYKTYPQPHECAASQRNILLVVDGVDPRPIVSELNRQFPRDKVLVAGADIDAGNSTCPVGIRSQSQLANLLAASAVVLVTNGGVGLSTHLQQLVTAALLMERRVVTDAQVGTLESVNFCKLDGRQWSEAVRTGAASEDYSFVSANAWLHRVEQLMRGEFPRSVSVIVLIHNNRTIVERCVSTLLACCGDWIHEIVVVDNCSSDGGAELVEELFGAQPKVKLVRNTENGCASGRNLGVSVSSGEFLAFFDSDQWLTAPSSFAEAVCILESDPSVGAVGWNAGWFDPASANLGGPISDYLPRRGMNRAALARGYREDIGFLGTSGMFMRRALFDRIGGFDTGYDPTCFEDTDLCFQIKQAGLAVVLRDLAGIRHQPHQTTGANSGSARYQELFHKNAEYFRRKWSKHPEFFTAYHD